MWVLLFVAFLIAAVVVVCWEEGGWEDVYVCICFFSDLFTSLFFFSKFPSRYDG